MTANHQECIVRLETVLHGDLDLLAMSDENPLPKRMRKTSVSIAMDRCAWRMSDEDHAFLMEESRNREECNEYDEELALEAREQEKEANKWREAVKPTNLLDESDEGSDCKQE